MLVQRKKTAGSTSRLRIRSSLATLLLLGAMGCRQAPSPEPRTPPAQVEPEPRPESNVIDSQPAPEVLLPGFVRECNALLEADIWYGYANYSDPDELPDRDFFLAVAGDSYKVPCEIEGDFDADGRGDTLIWARRENSSQPALVVDWGAGGRALVGHGDLLHFDPVPGTGSCAASSWGLVFGGISSPGRMSITVIHPGQPISDSGRQAQRDTVVLAVFDEETGELFPRVALDFDSGRWRIATLRPARSASVQDHGHYSVLPNHKATGRIDCRKSRRLRGARLAERESKLLLPTTAKQIDAGACKVSGDFDGDGRPDSIAWGRDTQAQHAMLFLRTAVSKPIPIGDSDGTLRAAQSEPGCNQGAHFWDDVISIETVLRKDGFWQLPEKRLRAEPTSETAQGDGLIALTADGHQNLYYLSDVGWRVIAIPFDWDKRSVVWPTVGGWLIATLPPTEHQPYRRPQPRLKWAFELMQDDDLPPVPAGAYIGNRWQ